MEKTLQQTYEEYINLLFERIKKVMNLGIKKILITDIHIPYISTNNNKYLTAWNKLYKEEKDFKIENNLRTEKDFKLKMKILLDALYNIVYSSKGYGAIINQKIEICFEIKDIFEAIYSEEYTPFPDMLNNIDHDGIITFP